MLSGCLTVINAGKFEFCSTSASITTRLTLAVQLLVIILGEVTSYISIYSISLMFFYDCAGGFFLCSRIRLFILFSRQKYSGLHWGAPCLLLQQMV